MPGYGRWWSRLAAATVLMLLVGLAIALHRPAGSPVGDDHAGHAPPILVPAAVNTAAPLPRTGWTVTADDAPASAPRVLDGDPATSWLTTGDTLPHWIAVDTHNRVAVSGLTYLPPAGGGGRIGQYRVEVSDDGSTWSGPVATGTFADDEILKTVTISNVVTRYVRLTAVAGPAGAAEINLLGGTDPALPRAGWTATADSQQATYPPANAIDGNTATMWHTAWTASPAPPLPHTFTVDMHATNLVTGLSYLPRQDTSAQGTIGQYRIETSADGTTWAPAAATGTFADRKDAQTVTFTPALARYVRLTALTEAGARGPWSSAAEINLLGRADPTLSRAGWTVSSDSQAPGSPPANVLDGDPATFWSSATGPHARALPHTLIVDLRKNTAIGGLSYLPRATTDGRIGQYRIATSVNGKTWTTRSAGASFADSRARQTVVFPPVEARYVGLTALTEAATRGPSSSAAEIDLLGPSGSVTPERGSWGAPIGFPLVPVAAALLPNGKILTWSSYLPDTYTGGGGRTVTATYDPATGVVTQRTVTETGHDMFCPGLSALPDGRILVTGGNDSDKTSIYDPATDAWTAGPPMTTARGYQAQATLADGRVFTIGGSWSGPRGGDQGNPHKAGEVWSPAAGWTALPGADDVPMLTADRNPTGDYRKDNHAWLFTWRGGKILQAGPSRAMNWYTADGAGSVTPAGDRGDDPDAMNGNAVMYDAGKILTIGGSPNYDADDATADAHVLTISADGALSDDDRVTVRTVGSMANTRAFANSVVLPDGKVLVIGGQNFAQPFSDNTAVLAPELWDPVSESFSAMAAEAVPRVYHSVALLMPDGRVFSAGGGLCGSTCPTNHWDGEIFTPPDLLTASGKPADRPAITSAPSTASTGDRITVRTDRAVTAFSIIRMGTATHSVDTDQRRISLTPVPASGGGYALTVPADPGIAVPGYWMLFALDARGVPSVAQVIRIS